MRISFQMLPEQPASVVLDAIAAELVEILDDSGSVY